MKKIYFLTLIFLLTTPLISLAVTESMGQKLSGRILLQVQSKGEAWYVNPVNQKRYSLGAPSQALTIMHDLCVGITNADLAKIPIGLINNFRATDNCQNNNFIKKNSGKIFLQTQSKGEAWYVNYADCKRYFLGKPEDAFIIMKKLGLGITDKNLKQIPIGELTTAIKNEVVQPIILPTDDSNIMEQAATAIRSNDQVKAKSFFSPAMGKMIEYTLNFLSQESRLMFANILSGSNLISLTTVQKIYSNKVYFSLGGYETFIKFYVQKQTDGKWLITNL
ncbi:MAG: hypothetical protein AAB653_02850 [Patescibacteria group bacterium]